MILDAQLELSDSQAVTADAVSTNTWDTGLALRDVGVGNRLAVRCGVVTALTAGTNVVVTLVDDDNAALSSPATIGTLGTFTSGSAPAGTELILIFPWGAKTQRYVGVNYNETGTANDGVFDCHVLLDPQHWTVYASGYTVLA